MRRPIVAAALGGLAVGLGVLGTSGTEKSPGPVAIPEPGISLATSPKVRTLYSQWKQTHEAAGGDRNILIPLGIDRNTERLYRKARGFARLNLLEGLVEVEARGLPKGKSFEVALVDNQGLGGALVDPEDHLLRLGTLEQTEERVTLRAKVDPKDLLSFDVDAVVIRQQGGNEKASSVALFGLPRAFQRIYTSERKGALVKYVQAGDSLIDRGERPRFQASGNETQMAALFGSGSAHAGPIHVDADVVLDAVVAAGAQLFINETFAGNGRTCASCHPASNNFTLDPAFIATLPASDPLFVAETNPALAELEDSPMLRSRALIRENVDGFDKPAVLRSVNHTLGLSQSLSAPICVAAGGCTVPIPGGPILNFAFGQQAAFVDNTLPPNSGFPPVAVAPNLIAFPLERTGWGGDGAPGSGTLREFAIGAIRQHLPKTLARVEGVDFRIPTDAELDALELFQLSLGRIEDLDLRKLSFKDPAVETGKRIFMTNDTQNGTVQAGKCGVCHFNAGANAAPEGFGDIIARFGAPRDFGGNVIFGTGVNNLTAAEKARPRPGPRDAGFGVLPLTNATCMDGTTDVSGPFPIVTLIPGSAKGGFGGITIPGVLPTGLCMEQFAPPPLVEAADTPPFFHNNVIDTIEDAVASYNSPAFNNDAQIRFFMTFTDSGKIGIQLTDASVKAIAKMLRTINSLENLRQAKELSRAALGAPTRAAQDQLIDQAFHELKDAKEVLIAVNLSPAAVVQITEALALNRLAASSPLRGIVWRQLVNASQDAMGDARNKMVTVLP